MQALAAKHSAGSARAECYPGVGNSCPCYGKCVREIPPKVWGLKPDFSRMMLATAAMVSATCAQVDYYSGVGNSWLCYYTFVRSRVLPATVRGCHCLGSVGVAICTGLGGARETTLVCILVIPERSVRAINRFQLNYLSVVRGACVRACKNC